MKKTLQTSNGKLALFTFAALVMTTVCFAQSSDLLRGKKLFDEKKYKESQRLLELIPEKSKDYAEARFYLGKALCAQELYDDASEALEEAVEVKGDAAEYHIWLANAYIGIAKKASMLKQGYLASKIKNEYEKTIQLDPSNLSAHWGLIDFYSQAPGFMGGSWEKAEQMAKAIGKINAGEGFRAWGTVYMRNDKPDLAEKQFIDAAKLSNENNAALGDFYLNQKKYAKAFSSYEKVLTSSPNNMSVVYQLGKTSAISGLQLDRGTECLKRYLAYSPQPNEPSHAGATMRLGMIFEKRGDKAGAKKMFADALKADPDLKEAKDGLDRVSK